MNETRFELRGEFEYLKDKIEKIISLKRLHLRTLSKLTCNQFEDVNTKEVRLICDELDRLNEILPQKEYRFKELKGILGFK
jgi:hypothetical protein